MLISEIIALFSAHSFLIRSMLYNHHCTKKKKKKNLQIQAAKKADIGLALLEPKGKKLTNINSIGS